MTIAERRHLALLEHQHRQLVQACQRLALANVALRKAGNEGQRNVAKAARTNAIAEVSQLLDKWNITE